MATSTSRPTTSSSPTRSQPCPTKTVVRPYAEAFILESVKHFVETSDEDRLKDPKLFVASAANFIAIAEKDIYDRFVHVESAIKYQLEKAHFHEAQKSQQPQSPPEDTLQAGTARGSSSQQTPDSVDIERERRQMEEAGGFYQLRRERKEAEQISSGKFFMENGKIYFGSAEKREPVSYSNWYAGNVDPEQLNRHKELLDRQHFSGPFWENRPMPKSVLDETFEQYLTGIEHEAPEQHPSERGYKQDDKAFESVKR